MVDKDASLQQAAKLMRERHVGTLVVVANGAEAAQALGVVGDREAAERAPLAAPQRPLGVRIPAYSYV